jgi:hypothetical protein
MDGNGQLHATVILCPKEIISEPTWIGGWVGPKASLNELVKRKNPTTLRN